MLNVTVILANINIVQKENPDSEKAKTSSKFAK